MIQLKEGINTFNQWVTGARAEKALHTYYNMSKEQEGQKQILAAAKQGDSVAADYLFLVFKKIIARVFWKYYLGPDKKYYRKRIEEGAAEEFATIAYSLLLGGGSASPYNTFNLDKFTGEADLIKQFGYYFYRYLQNESIKAIRADKMAGMTGNVSKDETVSTVSYEDTVENNLGDSVSYSSPSFEGNLADRDAYNQFLAELKSDEPVLYEILMKRMSGLTSNQIARQMGISGQTIRNYTQKIKQIYQSYI